LRPIGGRTANTLAEGSIANCLKKKPLQGDALKVFEGLGATSERKIDLAKTANLSVSAYY